MNNRFRAVLAQARLLSGDVPMTEAALIKEILHLDILGAIANSPLRSQLIFQGGTALRLCYGGQRYSEDLDFVHNAPLSTEAFGIFKRLLRETMEERYGLSLDVKDPKVPVGEPSVANGIQVRRWVARIDITAEARDMPHVHKIHLEVADVPAHQPQTRTIVNRYQPGAAALFLEASTIEEIFADKVIAMMYRTHIKARDIWDIKFLLDRNIKLDLGLVGKKAADYQQPEAGDFGALAERLSNRASALAEPESEDIVRSELSRFLPGPLASEVLGSPHGAGMLLMTVGQFLEQQAELLAGPEPAKVLEDAAAALAAWRKRNQSKRSDQEPGMG